MAILYKHFARIRTVFCAILFSFALLPVNGFAADTLFTIEGVEVDVTAQNSADARKEAFNEAQVKAFQELSRRMVAEGQGTFLSPPEPAVISTLIQDFEITKEKISHVRYVGVYTFRFNKDFVRNFFGGQGLGYTDVSSRPVMILPYYQGETRPVLWQDNNPFFLAWQRARNLRGIVPIVVPAGDSRDTRDLGQGDVLSFDPDGVEQMLGRYRAGEAVILLAIPDGQLSVLANDEDAAQGGLSVHLYRTGNAQPEHVGRIDIEASSGETRAALYDRAVVQVRSAIQQNWKAQTIVNAASGNRLQVKVRFGNLREWAETQNALERVQGVDTVKLQTLGRDHALVEIMFQGSEKRLRLALAQADMTLTKPRIGFDLASGASSSAALLYELYLNRYRPSGQVRNQPTGAIRPDAPAVSEAPEESMAPVEQREADESVGEKKSRNWRDWF